MEGPAKTKSRRGTETRKKSHPVTSRYDDAELAELDDAASRAGLTRGGFQRLQSLTTPPRTRSVRRAPIERQELARLAGQLGSVGNNINQLARAANRDRDPVEHYLVRTLEELNRILSEIRQACGYKS